MSPQIVSEIVR